MKGIWNSLFGVVLMFNRALAWIIIIMLSTLILGQLIKNGCVNIEPNKIMMVIVGCAFIIGYTDWFVLGKKGE